MTAHTPLVDLTEYEREQLDHNKALAARELARRQAAEDRQQAAARDNAQRRESQP